MGDIEESIEDLVGLLNQKQEKQTIKEESSRRYQQEIVPNFGPIRYLQFRGHLEFIKKDQDYGYYFKFFGNDIKLVKNVLEDNGFVATKDNDWSIMWFTGTLKTEVNLCKKNYQYLSPYQKVNHFPGSYELTRKDCMYRNIAKMQTQFGQRHFNFVPVTYILPQDIFLLKQATKQTKYIVKPSAKSQGKGIHIINDIQQKKNSSSICSEYIHNPLLINGLKFDLRIYVCITCINPLRIYIYNEGLVRFATNQYSNEVGDKFAHLTNYSINKVSENFVQNTNQEQDDQGSKWSLTALIKFFKQNSIPWDPIQNQINDLIIKSIIAIESQLFQMFNQKVNILNQVPYKNNCFEILGYDILLDEGYKPWLLEVNLSPQIHLFRSLACDSPLDQKIKSQLLADTFTLTGFIPIDQRLYQNLAINQASKNVYETKIVSNTFKPNMSSKKKDKQQNKDQLDNQTKHEKIALKETQEEFKRKQNYTRIFPSPYSQIYNQFFEQERPFNTYMQFFDLVMRKNLSLFDEMYIKIHIIKNLKIKIQKNHILQLFQVFIYVDTGVYVVLGQLYFSKLLYLQILLQSLGPMFMKLPGVYVIALFLSYSLIYIYLYLKLK